MSEKAFQKYYSDDFNHCYGCGQLNKDGLKIMSYWNPQNPSESICKYKPEPYHTAIPGYVYGGLIASLIDCHATGTAAAADYRNNGYKIGVDSVPLPRYVTAAVTVNYLKPTPIDTILELKGSVKEIKGRKIIISVSLSAEGEVCAQGEVVTVQMPKSMMRNK